MAALAKFRGSPVKKFRMITAVWGVAVQAAFCNRWMLPHERPSLVCVARITEFVDGVRLDLLVSEGAVNIMAVAAFDQTFFDGMVRLFMCLRSDIAMTSEAKLRLIFLQ
jgi:hypothetical protein